MKYSVVKVTDEQRREVVGTSDDKVRIEEMRREFEVTKAQNERFYTARQA